MNFEEIIDKLLDNGIEITVKKEDGIVWYDLNTQMKSELLIAKSPNKSEEVAITKGRYGPEGPVYSWDGLMSEVKSCLHGRSYMASSWEELLTKEGFLVVETTTVKSYS